MADAPSAYSAAQRPATGATAMPPHGPSHNSRYKKATPKGGSIRAVCVRFSMKVARLVEKLFGFAIRQG
jgi:hypothetical protein